MALEREIPILELSNVSLSMPSQLYKSHSIGKSPIHFIKSFYTERAKKFKQKVLCDLNFTLNEGDKLGVMGLNGSGKSTLIKLLAGIYQQDSGIITKRGRSSGLYNIQNGINQNATGVENIYLRGLFLGLDLKTISNKIEDIKKFTELGNNLYKPVMNYSTGMKLRLAFSISTIFESDIILMDEWIGSGDKNFSTKVQSRLNELMTDCKILILASHGINLLRTRCTLGLVLVDGKQKFFGDINEAIEFYRHHSTSDTD